MSALPVSSATSRLNFISANHLFSSRRRMRISASVAVDCGRKAESLYEILRVGRTASQMEIKTAYRSLAKLYHPDAIHDKAQSDGREFIEIHRAYETLSDRAARSVYDSSLGSYSQWIGRGGVGSASGSKPTRSWETDQCW